MKSLKLWGSATLAVASMLGCSQQAELEQREQFATCDDGRPSNLHVARDLFGATQAAADGKNGFWLFKSGTYDKGVVRVDSEGSIVGVLESPVGGQHLIESVVSISDDGVLLLVRSWPSGVFATDGDAELVRMDAAWTVRWQTPIDMLPAGQASAAALPDGGVIVAGEADLPQPAAEDLSDPSAVDAASQAGHGVFWARVSAAGEVLWQRTTVISKSPIFQAARASGPPLVVDPAGRVRLVVQSADGLVIVSSDLEGADEQEQLLDTRLALNLMAAAGLPDGRIAIVSDRRGAMLTMVDRAGLVLWEKGYGHLEQARPWSIAFNPVRDELLLSGSSQGVDASGSGSWLLAVGMEGDQLWSLERAPLEVEGTDGVIGQVDATRGPEVVGLAVGPDGTVLGAGYSGDELSYFRFGAGGCK